MKSKRIIQFTMFLLLVNSSSQIIKFNSRQSDYLNNRNQLLLKSKYSSENDIVQAIRNKLVKVNFKFFDVQDWTNLEEINTKILPEFIKVIDKDGLILNGDDLQYDISKFTIANSSGIENNILKLTAKYNERHFAISLNLDNNFTATDDEIAQTIKSWFEKTNTEKFKLVAWQLNNKEINSRIEKWFNNQLLKSTTKIKINEQENVINVNDIIFYSLDTDEILNNKLKLFFTYKESSIEQLTVSANIDINEEMFLATLKDKINNNLELFIPRSINYYNFVEEAPFEKWIEDIRKVIGSSIIIDNEEIVIDTSKIIFQDRYLENSKLNITPWSKSVTLPITYEIFAKKYFFEIEVQLRNDINYDEIKEAFIKEITIKAINGEDFENLEDDAIKNEILKQINNNFTNKISIKDKIYPFKLDELQIDDFIISYLNNEFQIELILKDWKISEKSFNVKLKLENYYIEKAFNELATILENNQITVDEFYQIFHPEHSIKYIIKNEIIKILNSNNSPFTKVLTNLLNNKTTVILEQNKLIIKFATNIEKEFTFKLRVIPFDESEIIDLLIPILEDNITNNITAEQLITLDFNKSEEVKDQINNWFQELAHKSWNYTLLSIISSKYGLVTINWQNLKVIDYEYNNDKLILNLNYPKLKSQIRLVISLNKINEQVITNYLITSYFNSHRPIKLDDWEVNELLYSLDSLSQTKLLEMITSQIYIPKILMSNNKYLEIKTSDFTWNGFYSIGDNIDEMRIMLNLSLFGTNQIIVINIKLI